jgi:hypothetical protein
MNAQTAITGLPLILSMHARYEAAGEEYDRLEAAAWQLNTSADHDNRRFAYKDALQSLEAESNDLRAAVLHQVPSTWIEALVLQYHIAIQFGGVVGPDAKQYETDTFEGALTTMLGFLAAEAGTDHAALGPRLRQSVDLARKRRRIRAVELLGLGSIAAGALSPPVAAALAAFAAAKAEHEAFRTDVFNPIEKTYYAARAAAESEEGDLRDRYTTADARATELTNAQYKALRDALAEPSSSLADVAAKADLVGAENCWDAEETSLFIADVRRLAGAA